MWIDEALVQLRDSAVKRTRRPVHWDMLLSPQSTKYSKRHVRHWLNLRHRSPGFKQQYKTALVKLLKRSTGIAGGGGYARSLVSDGRWPGRFSTSVHHHNLLSSCLPDVLLSRVVEGPDEQSATGPVNAHVETRVHTSYASGRPCYARNMAMHGSESPC